MSDPLISVRQAKEHAVDDQHHSDAPLADQSANATDTIGNILRSAREEIGWDIKELAQDLCVNSRYLEAIESGDHDKLPGRAYAIGFVRTYAGRLGLDTHEAVELFKREVASHDAESDLAFPEPVEERKTPIGAIIILALVLVIVVWGVFTILTTDDTQEPGVAEVPNELAESTGLTPTVTDTPPTDVTPDAQPIEAETSETVTTDVVAEPNPATQGASEANGATENQPAPQVETVSPQTNAGAVAIEEAILPATTSEIVTPVQETAPSVQENTGSVETAEQNAETATNEEAESAEPEPVVYGQVTGSVRVVLTATAPSWVMVKNSSGRTVFTRTLNKGDSYRVPNISGMVLRTGNAGGLSVSVDGNPAPSLGPSGAVRSQIILEPEPLVAGIQQIRPKPPAEQATPVAPSAGSSTTAPAAATESSPTSESRPSAPAPKPNF